ncbi:MAG TPA: protocatechuate 3,4-dioxygenase subunit alpha [Terriglobales bacterium]|jgi:protocatechuate 3,4-dioxygenase alpha subunit|nr:protocatechuate 3,4-dioxygenase subunit alpha [Terriglobales bacterium]
MTTDWTPTPSQTAGPFLHLGLTDNHSVACVAGKGAEGEPVRLTFRVLDGDGAAVPDAMIEVWQADCAGEYSNGAGTSGDATFRGFGRLATADDGSCTFETIKPGRVPGPADTFQAPHINVSVFARGLLKRLSTRVYFAGEAANAEDPILALVPENRRPTLLAQPDPHRAGGWIFAIRLRGQGETVFFDV